MAFFIVLFLALISPLAIPLGGIRRLLLRLLPLGIVLTGCGSQFFEIPPGGEPDPDECTLSMQDFTTQTLYTSAPLPFSGRRTVKMSTWVPDGWDQFEGTLHLLTATWDVTWVERMQMDVDRFPAVAVWNGYAWRVDKRVDFMPYIERDGDRLRFEPKVRAKGVKPAGKPITTINVIIAFCGEGSEEVRP